MTLYLRPFRPEDLHRLELQHVQKGEDALIEDPPALADGGEAWTMIDAHESGFLLPRVRACGGLLYFTAARAKAWSLIGRELSRREWGFLARRMAKRLDELQHEGLRRVEAETRLDFAGGHKFLLHLGFRFEGVQYGAAHDGAPLGLFARLGNVDFPHNLVRYEKVRSLGYAMVLEDVLARRHDRRAAQ